MSVAVGDVQPRCPGGIRAPVGLLGRELAVEPEGGGASDGDRLRHAQVMTYAEELPRAFRCNMACVVTDGITARYVTAFTPFEHFAPWTVDEHGKPVPRS